MHENYPHRSWNQVVAYTFVFMIVIHAFGQNGRDLFRSMRWRQIGPANFSGRIVDVEALETDFRHVVVASASGGVWKSVNAGTTWEPIFDDYNSASIGDIALCQADPDIIWVGTGEANNRNSVAWGDGIYKSTDGGRTFQNMGLEDTYQIARIIIDPDNYDIVYVAAIGNLWGYTGIRGLYKTTDGGQNWAKLTNGLPDDGKTGATDLVMDPTDPRKLYVAFYQRIRKPYRFDSGGSNGGVFKTTDGGASWIELTQGLPEGDTGRIGLDIYRSNPNILVALVEHGFHPGQDDAEYGDMTHLGSGIYRSENGGETWMYMNRYNNRPFYYSQIRINPLNDQRVYVLTTTIQISEDGGRTFHTGGIEFEGGLDFHAMWIDPTHGDRYYLGKDKGLTLTFDHGDTFILFDNMPIGQFYAVGVDMRDPYYVYGGTQDNGTWGGPSFSRDVRGILADSWWKLHWGDGMFIQIDPTDWRKVYTEAENGSFRRYDPLTRRVEFARPNRNNIVNYSDVISSRRDERGEREDGRPPFRFNWRAPLVMSPHNPQTLYLGGNHLFMTVDEGVHWKIISPDLSTNDDEKTNRESGGLTRDVTGAETHCSITSISESPVVPGLIWAGTDDGNVQVTRDGGARWENVRKRIKWISSDSWVSCVEASHFDPGTCYVTFDGHRSADFSTWICKTTDYGKTWNSISDNIPHGHSMYVVREDLKNRDLLFAGSEFTCFASLDGGKTWHRFMNNMPTVAFHDLVIHPRDGDLIAATHGRSFWILDDITPLQQLNDEILESEAHIFEQRPATIWEDASRGGVRGHFYFAGDNPPYIPENRNFVRGKLTSGGLVSYYLKLLHPGDVQIEICDFTGQKKRTLFASGEPGINRVLWDLRYDPSENQKRRFVQQMENLLTRIESMPALTSYQTDWIKQVRGLLQTAKSDRDLNQIREDLTDEFGHIFALRRAFGNALQGDPVEPGDYLIKMNVNGDTVQGTITVREDPILESGKDD